MLNARIHKFIVLLLLLAFTSQTMATAAMNCEAGKMTSKSKNLIPAHEIVMDEMDMSSMDHSDPAMMHMHHQMAKINSSQNTHQQFDCCKTMGHCLLGGCALVAASNAIRFIFNTIDSGVDIVYVDIAPSSLASSLYRPPISC